MPLAGKLVDVNIQLHLLSYPMACAGISLLNHQKQPGTSLHGHKPGIVLLDLLVAIGNDS